MFISKKYLSIILILTFSFLGCENLPFFGKKPQSKEPSSPVVTGRVIAKVNNMAITQEDLDRYADTFNRQIDAWKTQYPGEEVPKKIETTQERIEVLRNVLVRQKLLYQEAQDRGLERKPDIVSAVEDFKTGLLISELASQEQEKIRVSSDEIEKFYNANKASLREPEERRILQIVTKTESDSRTALIDVLKGDDFKDVARRYSIAGNATSGGDLGFIKFPIDRSPTRLEEEAYRLETGRTSNIFRGEDNNYYIIKVEEKKGGRQLSLSELWENIKKKLEADKQKEVFDNLVGRLQSKAKIEILEDEVR